jgi:ATP-dependent protease HslVU (ClpYQ) peptidase subunit
MSTIATDGKAMAADGLVTSNGTAWAYNFEKIAKLPDGRIAGSVGSAYYIGPFVAWLENGGDFPETGDDFEGLVLSPDGSVRSYDPKGRSIAEEVPTASGSGREIALGAMLAGASPAAAVGIAAKRDICTGGNVVEFALKS